MTQVTRRELFPGVWLRTVHTDKFKSSYLSLTMLVPLERERAAANALLFQRFYKGSFRVMCRRLGEMLAWIQMVQL